MSAAIASLPALRSNGRLDRYQLDRLFVEHYRRVLMAAYRITGNMADAEDVAQGVFLRLGAGGQAGEQIGELAGVANAGSYLYRAAINGALDLLRRKKHAAAEPLDAAAELVSSEAAAMPETAAANRELAGILREAIAELAPRAAEMFALRYVEEMGNREIAEVMGTSQAVVAVTLYQARLKLKRRLNEWKRGMR